MKLHFVSRGYAIPLGFRAINEGAEVTVHLPDYPMMGENMLHKTISPKPLRPGSAVIFDGKGWGKVAQELERDGHRVLFGGMWTEVMALKKNYNWKVLERAGLPTVDSTSLRYFLFVGAWFEDGHFTTPYYAGISRMRLLAGDVGPIMGLVSMEVMPLETPDSPLVSTWLLGIEPQLESIPYRGPISVYLAPAQGGLAATDITPGVQPLLIECLSEMTPGGFSALIDYGPTEPSSDCAVALALTLPPWPYGIAKPEPKQYIDLDKGQARHFWPLDVAKDETGMYCAGTSGAIGVASARGKPIMDEENAASCWFRQAGSRARAMIPRLGIPDVQYRNDIGYRTVADFAPLLG